MGWAKGETSAKSPTKSFCVLVPGPAANAANASLRSQSLGLYACLPCSQRLDHARPPQDGVAAQRYRTHLGGRGGADKAERTRVLRLLQVRTGAPTMVGPGCYSMPQHLYRVASGLSQLSVSALRCLEAGFQCTTRRGILLARGCMAGNARLGQTCVAGQVAGGNRSLPLSSHTSFSLPISFVCSLWPGAERNATWTSAPPPTAHPPHTAHSPQPTAHRLPPTIPQQPVPACIRCCRGCVAAASLPLERALTWTGKRTSTCCSCTHQTIPSARCFVPGMLAHKVMEQSSLDSGSGSGSGSTRVRVRVRVKVDLLH